MKRRFIFFLVIIIASVFGIGGCTNPNIKESTTPQVRIEDVQDDETSDEVEEIQIEAEDTIETSGEITNSSEVSDIVEVISLDEELEEEMELFFQAFLKAYINGDEETFKTYMSEELYNEYLDFEIGSEDYYNDTYYLNMIIDEKMRGWVIFNSHIAIIHNPGITFFTRLSTQYAVDDKYGLGDKFLVNISYNENNEFLINWFTRETP